MGHPWKHHTCAEDVTRRGLSQPCDKPAVALRIDPTGGNPYPVCAYHTRGPGSIILLRDVPETLAAIR